MSPQIRTPGGVLAGLAGFLGFSALAGVLTTVLIAPVIAVGGVAASSSIGVFEDLPEYIEINQLPARNTIFANTADGPVPIATVFDQNREEVGWDQVSQFLKDAAVAGEDRRFFEHGGVDVNSVARAAVGNVTSGGISSGGSTLTMQLVKNIKVQEAESAGDQAAYDAAVEQTFGRKLEEMKLAIGLEKTYSKDEVLLAYLNIANFGDATYGVQAAAQRYFSVNASDLTLAQAASIVAIVQYPSQLNLSTPENYERNKERRDFILRMMETEGYIDQAQYDEAVATPIEPRLSQQQNGCMAATYEAQFFCDYVVKSVGDIPALGATPEERAANWKTGGYDVYTTLDAEMNVTAQDAMDANVPNDETRLQLGGAESSVEVGTGRVLTMVQNKDYNNTLAGGGNSATAVNYNTDRPYGGSGGFQTGSTYKVFTLVDWLQSGHGLQEQVNGARRTFQLSDFEDSCSGGYGGPWNPKNSGGGDYGNVDVLTATAQSINTAYISMAEQLDQCEIRGAAESLGVHTAGGEPLATTPSSTLGVNTIAPLTMAAAFAAIAGQGVYCAPVIVDQVVSPDGEELGGQPRACAQAIEPDVANTVAYAMERVMTNGTGTASNPAGSTPVIGKTGTTDSYNQTWIVAGTTKVMSAVWVGNITGQYSMRSLGGGSTMRHRVQNAVLSDAISRYGGDAFPGPAEALLRGTNNASVPDVAGRTVDEARGILEQAGFRFEDGGATQSALPPGTVVGTDPGAGATTARGATVRVTTSDGSGQTPVPDVSGQELRAAVQALAGAGFTTLSAQWTAGPQGQQCRVISTDPAPGTATAPGTPVTIQVVGTPQAQDPGTCS